MPRQSMIEVAIPYRQAETVAGMYAAMLESGDIGIVEFASLTRALANSAATAWYEDEVKEGGGLYQLNENYNRLYAIHGDFELGIDPEYDEAHHVLSDALDRRVSEILAACRRDARSCSAQALGEAA